MIEKKLEELTIFVKMAWSFNVFCHQLDKEAKQENLILWEKIVELLNLKLSFLDEHKSSSADLNDNYVALIEQINCSLKLDFPQLKKTTINIPEIFTFNKKFKITSNSHLKGIYTNFAKRVLYYLGSKELLEDSYAEHYRIVGGINLESECEKWDKVYFVLNEKHQYFEDTKDHNSFVKIRRDHFQRMGLKLKEIEFYDVISLFDLNLLVFGISE